MKLLLHACCGPCSLEPVRLLQQQGHEITIAYINSNIDTQAEYEKRLLTLQDFAGSQGVRVIDAKYNPHKWEETAGKVGLKIQTNITMNRPDHPQTVAELLDDNERQKRCRVCYRMRLREAARIAREGEFDAFTTTLAVSPYQFTEVIRDELAFAGQQIGVPSYFEDFRPYYDRATQRSRDLGMYRQNYCGCKFSVAEGEATRDFLREEKAKRKQARQIATIEQQRKDKAEAQQRKQACKEYAEKQRRKRELLKQYKQQNL